jgi:ABC-2 type transport system ATP-binding protein
VIELIRLRKEYDDLIAVQDLTLSIPQGEIYGLIGPNGAGKTTTIRMACGLLAPTIGQTLINGIDVAQEPEMAQQSIGYLSDFFAVYEDLKVWEYLDYFARAYKMEPHTIPPRVDEVLRLMNLETKRDAFIHGLSRGMKQRLGIGRAIIHNPPLLVLDEPAAGLDPKARVELKGLLKDLHSAGKTIFITSHILSDLEEICTNIAIMEKGKLLRIGTLEKVMREGTSVRRYRIRLAEPGFGLALWLAGRKGVTGIVSEPASANFALDGGEPQLAELVKDLVAAGAPVCEIQEVVETLERLYSRISSGEVM